MSPENKNGIIGIILGFGLAWVIVWIIDRDSKKEEPVQPKITDETIRIAVESYSKAVSDGQPQENLDEINSQLLSEFGLKVVYKPLESRMYVYDKKDKLIKAVDNAS